MTPKYRTNELGDVFEVQHPDGTVESVDPSEWGWIGEGGANDPEQRRSIESLRSLPWFDYTEAPITPFVPGPKTPRHKWEQWPTGEAPPAYYESSGGSGGYFNRLSEAVGFVATSLPKRESASTITIYDFVAGRSYTVTYSPPFSPEGGIVYLLDDGFGIKVGFTGQEAVATRIGQLQTGNPRSILPMAEIRGATEAVEAELHDVLADYNISGEWFDRQRTVQRMSTAGSVREWLATATGIDASNIHLYPPYQ